MLLKDQFVEVRLLKLSDVADVRMLDVIGMLAGSQQILTLAQELAHVYLKQFHDCLISFLNLVCVLIVEKVGVIVAGPRLGSWGVGSE